MLHFIKKNKLIFLYLISYVSIISYKIILHPWPFYDWDESIYIEVGREMVRHKSLIPFWQGHIWLDKPPLVMFIYGWLNHFFFFIQPEIISRLFNLFLVFILLIFLYIFYKKISKSRYIALLTVILTSFTPLFVQKAYTVNMDVFLLLGWIGYVLFFESFILSTFFLSLSIFSKSLVGFYPIILYFIFYIYLLAVKEIKRKKFLKIIKKLLVQIFIFSLWYIAMTILFKGQFIKQHIIESHFRRITSSIEFHFGEKIFYITLLFKELGYFILLSILGFFSLLVLFFKRKIKPKQFLYANFLFPWFIFLNLTKTKIFWYLYPALSQFAFYSFYPLLLIKRKKFFKIALVFIFLAILFWGINKKSFLQVSFSKFDDYYKLAQSVKSNCNKLYFLPEKNHRQAMNNLEKMGLTITTTKWWGNHPSIVYYSEKPVVFIYNENKIRPLAKLNKDICLGLKQEDMVLIGKKNKVKILDKFGGLFLLKI